VAKEYQQPTRTTKDDDEDNKATRGSMAGSGQTTQAPNPADDKIAKEQQAQSDAAAKERQTYLDELNRRIGEVVNFAGQNKEKNPQLLNLASEALKNAADQIDAATPQGVTRKA
jgi:hypothetical protein